jgi:hypothetical protein
MTVRPAAGQADCQRPDPVLLLTPSRQKIDKEALMRKLLGVTLALVAVALILPETGPLSPTGGEGRVRGR